MSVNLQAPDASCEELERTTRVANYLLIALGIASLSPALPALQILVMLSCLIIGAAIGWGGDRPWLTPLRFVGGMGVIAILLLTVQQWPQTPRTFDGVLILLGRFLAGVAACQAFDAVSRRAGFLRQMIALALLSVAATAALRPYPAWSLVCLALFVAVWIFTRRTGLLLAQLEQAPALADGSRARYRWHAQLGSSAVSLLVISATAVVLFWRLPHLPLLSSPWLKGLFGSPAVIVPEALLPAGHTPPGETESAIDVLKEGLAETGRDLKRAMQVETVDRLRQQGSGLFDLLDAEHVINPPLLQLQRTYFDRLASRRVHQLAKQEDAARARITDQTAGLSTHVPAASVALAEELAFLEELVPDTTHALQRFVSALATSHTMVQLHQLHRQMDALAKGLPELITLEEPDLLRLIESLVQERQRLVEEELATQPVVVPLPPGLQPPPALAPKPPLLLMHIKVEPPTANVVVGETVHLLAYGVYSNGQRRLLARDVRWRSHDAAVGSIDAAGLVRGGAVGHTDVTAAVGSVTSAAVVVRVHEPLERTLARWGAIGVILLILLVLVVCWCVARRLLQQRWLQALAEKDPHRFIVVVYHLLAQQLGCLGWIRPAWMVPEEYACVLTTQLGEAAAPAIQIVTDLFLQTYYSLAPAGLNESRRMADAQQTVLKAVRQRLAWWQRWRWWLRSA